MTLRTVELTCLWCGVFTAIILRMIFVGDFILRSALAVRSFVRSRPALLWCVCCAAGDDPFFGPVTDA